jgi:hypothetical protein
MLKMAVSSRVGRQRARHRTSPSVGGQGTARSTRCALRAAACAYSFFGLAFGTTPLQFSSAMQIDMSVEHFVNARRRRLRILKGKVIIGFDLGMDWDER